MRRGKKEERENKVPMSDGCSTPSFLVVYRPRCSIRASLTCLFEKKVEQWEGDTIPSPAHRCFARRLAILIGHQHTVPSLLVVGSSIPSFLVLGCSIRASFTCLFKKNFERRESDTLSIPSLPLYPLYFPLDPPLDECNHHCPPTFQNRSAPVAIIFQPSRYTIAGRLSESRLPSFLVVA